MRINDILLEYDRTRALAALGKKFQDAVVKNAIRYWGSNWQQLPRAQAILNDPSELQELVQAAIQEIELADPTPNKKYTQWMARQFGGPSATTTLEDVTSTLSDYIHKFHKLNQKRRLQPPLNDINRYRDVYHLMDVLDDIPDDEQEAKGQAQKAYQDSDVSVIIPLDQEAACKYGRQTRWCTAAVHGTNYFNEYNKQGPLYVLLPQKPIHKDEKYQLHFPTAQYMDEDDEPVELLQLLKTRFPKLRDWLKTQPGTGTYNSIALAEDSVLQNISDDVWDHVEGEVMDVYSDKEANNLDGYFNWLDRQGYVDEDGQVKDNAPSYGDYDPEIMAWMDSMADSVHVSAKDMRRIALADDRLDDWIETLTDYIREDRVGSNTEKILDFMQASITIETAPGKLPVVFKRR